MKKPGGMKDLFGNEICNPTRRYY